MPISFTNFMKQRQKKKTGYRGNGITGLPTFSNKHPYFSGRLRVPDGDDANREHPDCGGPGEPACDDTCDPTQGYCYPWQNQGPDGDLGDDPHHPDDNWDAWEEWRKCIAAGGGADCGPPQEPDPPTFVCANPPCLVDSDYEIEPEPPDPPDQPRRPISFRPNENRPERPGPDGPDETDDLFDPWKYRGVTNPHSFLQSSEYENTEDNEEYK